MSQRTLVDTGPLVALFSTRDQHHSRCVVLSKDLQLPLYTSWPVITEAAHLIGRAGGQSRDVLGLVKNERLVILPLTRTDLIAIDAIMAKYADQKVSVADASLMHLAEREAIDEVFTVDPKDFSVFRTAEGRSLKVIA